MTRKACTAELIGEISLLRGPCLPRTAGARARAEEGGGHPPTSKPGRERERESSQ